MRKPSQRSIDLYNQLIAQQNKVRKTLTRIHKHAEETSGSGRLPALVIPRRSRKISRDYFEGLSKAELKARIRRFWSKYKEAKNLFGKGLRSYLGRTVKDGYMDLWRDQILFISGEEPQGYFGKYSKEQIENSFMGDFMEVYNRLISLSPEVFLAMLYHGDIIQFKYIYAEMTGMGNREYSWIDQQVDNLDKYRTFANKRELLNFMGEKDIMYNHTRKTMSKAEKMKESR